MTFCRRWPSTEHRKEIEAPVGVKSFVCQTQCRSSWLENVHTASTSDVDKYVNASLVRGNDHEWSWILNQAVLPPCTKIAIEC